MHMHPMTVRLLCLALLSVPAWAQDQPRPVEVSKVEINPRPLERDDEFTVTANVRNTTGRLLLVNVRLLIADQVVILLPGAEQIVFLEADASRTMGWRGKVVGEGKWSVRVSAEVVSEGRPLNGPRQEIAAAAKEALARPWAGTWTSPDGYVYDADVRLQVGSGSAVEGSIAWTLRKAPEARKDYADKIGAKGTEYVWGVFDPQSRNLDLEGYRRDDPKQVLGLDKYRLTLSEDHGEIKGATWNHGTWKAAFTLAPK